MHLIERWEVRKEKNVSLPEIVVLSGHPIPWSIIAQIPKAVPLKQPPCRHKASQVLPPKSRAANISIAQKIDSRLSRAALLQTWVNLNLTMNKQKHAQLSVGRNCLSMPKLQRLRHRSLGLDK